ncbi:MAG: flavodoxin-dependent (E)-4-hydroxy-3-methylbut-2-enyl-diphosphate synthase, partial [Oscillospiraceae bacterium]
VVSIKTSDVNNTVKAYRLLSQQCNYPLHLGVTETGTVYNGIIKSSVGIGSLLIDSIGDTIRVSLSTDPIEEIKCAKAILRSIGIIKDGVNIISCPTCGRTKIDLFKIISQVEQAFEGYSKPLTVAVMGCAVNGPGEASQADIGIAGGDGCAVIFKKGKIIKKVPQEDVVKEMMSLI